MSDSESEPKIKPKAKSATKIFNSIYGELVGNSKDIVQGLKNLETLPEFSTPPPTVNGKEFNEGVIGFRRFGSNLNIAIACGTAQVRYLDLAKFVSLIENMHDPDSATIMLQNFQDRDEYRASRGQVMGRLNAKSSAIHIIQGVTGRIIQNSSDIAIFDVYYIDRVDLTTFYLSAKTQLSNAHTLETMIASYDGWRAYNVPLDPLNPYSK